MRSALHQKRLLFAGGNTAEEEYKAKKCNGHDCQLVYVYDVSNPDPNKRRVQAYEHVSTKPKEDSDEGPNTWGFGNPQHADEAFTRAMRRLDGDEPAFITVTAEGLPPSSKRKSTRMGWRACGGGKTPRGEHVQL